MYIDVGACGGVVIYTVNWLHYLNYEPIACSSSNYHYFIQGTSSSQTVSSHGWCDRFTHDFSVISLSGERLMVEPSYPADCVVAFHGPSPSFGLHYSW